MRPNLERPIVIVDDSDADFDVTREVFGMLGVKHPIVRLADGQSAQAYLRRTSPFEKDTEPPALIILDLSLPWISGLDLLQQLRATSWLRTIPGLVMSTSNNPRDIDLAYERGANSYFTKPMDFQKVQRRLALISEYWLEAACVPPARLLT